MSKTIIFLGAPGAGKGTQCEFLAKQGFQVVSTGNLLRAEVSAGTPLGQEVSRVMQSGQLVSNEIVENIVISFLSRQSDDCLIAFDGFPRTLEQAHFLDEQLEKLRGGLDLAFYLDVPTDVIVERLSTRVECADCAKVVSASFVVDGKCPQCGNSKLTRRADDEPEVIRKRLDNYQQQTAPLIEHYRKLGKLVAINGSLPIETINQQIAESLSSLHG